MNQSGSKSPAASMAGSRIALHMFILFAVMLPLVLPIVRRAAPVFLVGVALLVVLHRVRRQEWRGLFSDLSTMPIVLGSCFLLWAAVTCLWAPDAVRAWQAVANGALIFFSALCVRSFSQGLDQRLYLYASIAMSVSALTIIIDLKTGGVLLHLIHSRPEPYRYNMVLVSLVILSFALFCEGTTLTQPMKYVAAAILLSAVFISESESAKLSILAGYIVLLLSRFVSSRVSFWLFLVGSMSAWAVFLIKPDLLSVVSRIWPSLAEQGHAVERIQIWIAYSKFALAGLPWGWGVESVSQVPLTSYYATVPDLSKADLEWLHPHNNIIQIVAETGLLGTIFVFAASMMLVIWAHSSEQLRPARAGLVTSVFIVALVSHGFWQMWWWSAVAVSCVLLRRVEKSNS